MRAADLDHFAAIQMLNTGIMHGTRGHHHGPLAVGRTDITIVPGNEEGSYQVRVEPRCTCFQVICALIMVGLFIGFGIFAYKSHEEFERRVAANHAAFDQHREQILGRAIGYMPALPEGTPWLTGTGQPILTVFDN